MSQRMNVEEAAKMLDISPLLLRKWIRDQHPPWAICVEGKKRGTFVVLRNAFCSYFKISEGDEENDESAGRRQV